MSSEPVSAPTARDGAGAASRRLKEIHNHFTTAAEAMSDAEYSVEPAARGIEQWVVRTPRGAIIRWPLSYADGEFNKLAPPSRKTSKRPKIVSTKTAPTAPAQRRVRYTSLLDG